jgi:hypothetical protein
MITAQPRDAIVPTWHMSRIAAGVLHREAVGWEFMAGVAATEVENPRARQIMVEQAREESRKRRHDAEHEARKAGRLAELKVLLAAELV